MPRPEPSPPHAEGIHSEGRENESVLGEDNEGVYMRGGLRTRPFAEGVHSTSPWSTGTDVKTKALLSGGKCSQKNTLS